MTALVLSGCATPPQSTTVPTIGDGPAVSVADETSTTGTTTSTPTTVPTTAPTTTTTSMPAPPPPPTPVTKKAVPKPRVVTKPPAPKPTLRPKPPAPKPKPSCDPSYPTVCIPPAPPDLDCGQIPHRKFAVRGADPHGFDSDNDGVGCES